jgi:hypothetical protein
MKPKIRTEKPISQECKGRYNFPDFVLRQFRKVRRSNLSP